MVFLKQSGHIGPSFSCVELLCWLYNNFNLAHPTGTAGDILALSKGHAAPALYGVQLELGLFPEKTKETFREIDSPFQGHPDPRYNKYVHCLTGSLGQGLSQAAGQALAMRFKGQSSKAFAIVGDGEFDEGQCYECLQFASNYYLDNLICFVDCNGFQNDNPSSNTLDKLYDKFEAFGWETSIINGHSTKTFHRILPFKANGKPKAILAKTIKGKGVSFMENNNYWHSGILNLVDYEYATKELL